MWCNLQHIYVYFIPWIDFKKMTRLTIKEHVSPQGNDGVVWVPDEEYGLTVAEGQVGRPEGACTYDVGMISN